MVGEPGAVRGEPALTTGPEAPLRAAESAGEHENTGPSVSAVVPLLDECVTLAELHSRLAIVLRRVCGECYEIIFVDDGSTDGSVVELQRIVAADTHVTVVELRRNFGKASAMAAGLAEARNEVVVTIDADLQDVPEELPRLLEPIAAGVDLVTGRKRTRRDPKNRVLASWFFNRAVSWITGVRVRDVNSGFKAMRREVMQELPLHGGLHRYLPVFARAKGFAIAEVDVSHQARRSGRSRYGTNRYMPGLLDTFIVMLLTRYDMRPFHFFGRFGLVLAVAGSGILLFLSVGWLFGHWIGARPLLIFGVLLVVLGVQSAFFGILAQLIVLSGHEPRAAHRVRRVTRGGANERPHAARSPPTDP